MKVKISILMPVRNAAPFLEACLNSVRAQAESSWELIAINDRSTDNSADILEQYQKLDERITTYNNDGAGIISALRLAYSKCQGRYITRMDADDLMPEDKLESMANRLDEVGRGHVITGLVEYFSDEGVMDGYHRYANWLNELTVSESNFAEIYKECVIPSPCWMLDRQDLEEIGAFDSDVYPEDYDLCFRMYRKNLKVSSIRRVMHFWRDHSHRASRTDPNYEDNRFLVLKLSYFLELEHHPNVPLIVWGAGQKGKLVARHLLEKGIKFHWITENDNKVGHVIYGIQMKPSSFLSSLSQSNIILLVANPKEQKSIRERVKLLSGKNQLHLFC